MSIESYTINSNTVPLVFEEKGCDMGMCDSLEAANAE
jgi:hypothetical protein